MRLIDADALLNEFNPDSDVLIDNIAARMRIVKQPTAYDIDKVVQKIEESSYVEAVDDMDPFGDIKHKVVRLDKAIEIVKHGCVGKDVEEW